MKTAPIERVRELLAETPEELYAKAPCGYFSALPRGTIVRANERMAAMTGHSVTELIEGHVSLQDLLAVGSRVYYETHVSPLLLMQGFVEEIALDLRGIRGHVPVLLNAVLRRDAAGRPLGIRASVVDVSHRRRYERELLAARDEAEEAARAKGELMSMVSHDLRSPLAAIMSVGELLEQSELSADQAEYVRLLKSSASKLLNLVNDVVDTGRLEAGRMRLQEKPLDLRKLVDELATESSIAAARKGITLKTNVDEAIPEELVGDPIKLGRVLGNLLGNAVKFTDSGHVTLSVEQLDGDDRRVSLAFEVRDTGIGIGPKQLDLIFEDFTQGSDEIGSKYGGSGLGLGICKRLLALHGAALSVRSAPGQGSRFSFELTLERG